MAESSGRFALGTIRMRPDQNAYIYWLRPNRTSVNREPVWFVYSYFGDLPKVAVQDPEGEQFVTIYDPNGGEDSSDD